MNAEEQEESSSIFYFSTLALFGQQDRQLLCSYKFFVENVILQLGEDWKIQSTLFTEEINHLQEMKSQKNQGNASLFNQFLSAFLKGRSNQEYQSIKQHQNHVQERFMENVKSSFNEEEIHESLTFKTLSLGFCITAQQIWNKNFQRPSKKQEINVELTTFAKLSGNQYPTWSPLNAQQIDQLNFSKLKKSMQKANNSLAKSQILSKMVCYINQINTGCKKVRIFQLSNQFYLGALVVWLIFNIKLSFSLSSQKYVQFCKNYFHNQWKDQFEQVVEEYKQLLDNQWSQLLQNYTIALHDDLQALKMLIDNIHKHLSEHWGSTLAALAPPQL